MKNNNYNLIMLVIASRGDIYDQIINCYWVHLINYIKKHNYPIKIVMLFGNDKVDDLSLSTEDVLFFNDNISEIFVNLYSYILSSTFNIFEVLFKIFVLILFKLSTKSITRFWGIIFKLSNCNLSYEEQNPKA